MAAPKYAPLSPTDASRAYSSPDYVPDPWVPERPAEIEGRQPQGERLGYQGPDQGYALKLVERFRDRVHLQPGESFDDAARGCLNIALRRASRYGRAPVIHDLTVAFTMWGFLDANPPRELVEVRRRLFEGVANTTHHYTEGRLIADQVPAATLELSHDQVAAAYARGGWQALTGATA
jgi:hypothetical protein